MRLGSALVALLACTAGAGAAQQGPPGQQLTVTPQQDLLFGVLTPGVPTAVYVDDAAKRAEWRVEARGRVSVTILLPTALTGPQGEQLPLQFAAGDAGFLPAGTSVIDLYDPHSTFQVSLRGTPGVGLVLLGGTALPAATQSAGSYTADITIIVAP